MCYVLSFEVTAPGSGRIVGHPEVEFLGPQALAFSPIASPIRPPAGGATDDALLARELAASILDAREALAALPGCGLRQSTPRLSRWARVGRRDCEWCVVEGARWGGFRVSAASRSHASGARRADVASAERRAPSRRRTTGGHLGNARTTAQSQPAILPGGPPDRKPRLR